MSSMPIDPEAQAYIDDFQQRLTQSARFYRQALRTLYEDRVMRDLENINQPPQPSKRLLRRAAHAGKRAGKWVVRRLSAHRTNGHETVRNRNSEVIEGSYVVLSDEIGPVKPASDSQADVTANLMSIPIIQIIYKEDQP